MAGVPVLAIVCFLTVCSNIAAASDFEFTCPQNVVAASPPIVNETAYSYKATISVEGKNETVDAYELYDMGNGTVLLYVHFPDPNNSSLWVSETIFHDYNYNQTFVIDTEAKTCVVSDLMHNETYSIFGKGIEDGFQNPEFSFRWTEDYNYTMENGTYVNGATADKYSTCLLFNNSQMMYDVELYFSTAEWNMRSGENAPLMVVLKVNQTKDGGESFMIEKYTYLFTSYSLDSNSYTPKMPFDLICPGRKDSLPPPEMANNFGYSEEIVNPNQKAIFSSRKYNNYDDKLYRSDFIGVTKSSAKHLPTLLNHHYTIIHDFHSGVEYLIDKELGNCTMSPISMKFIWDYYDVEMDPTHPGHFRMRNYIDFDKQRNFTYTGRHSTHAGMTVDAWTSTVPIKWNATVGKSEMYETKVYTTPDWKSGNLSPVPISTAITVKTSLINGTIKTSKMVIHISDIVTRMHGSHMFEIGMCFGEDSRKNYVLKFAASYSKYIEHYSAKMDASLQEAVAKAANISKIRVASYASKEVGRDSSKDGKNSAQNLFISISVYDQPSIHANTTEYTPGINLTAAISNLKAAVESNKLQLKFNLETGEEITMTAYPDYFKERSDLYAPPGPDPVAKGLSTGAVAALCIGMVVLGAIIGAGVCHFRYKRGNRQFGYSIQD